MNHEVMQRVLRRAGMVAAAALVAVAGVAQAGECPTDKRVADGTAIKDPGHAAKGVTDVVINQLDVASEPSVRVPGRTFRGRRLDILPGGIVPWHSHADRPALLLIASGEITGDPSFPCVWVSRRAVPARRSTSQMSPRALTARQRRSRESLPAARRGAIASASAGLTSSGVAPACARTR